MVKEHWIEILASKVAERCSKLGKNICVLNGGLSVSGLQHVGRLRGEVVLNDALRRVLEREHGLKVRQYLTLYTMDPWKGKERQLAEFKNPEEARRYVDWPLEMVPDPYGCHRSWVEHYWEDFGKYLPEFAHDIEVVTTGEMYRSWEKMRRFIKLVLERRLDVIRVLNKYRGRNPYPDTYIPFEPRCESCGRIGKAKTISIDVDKDEVVYRCECGYEGKGRVSEGKLPWRIEWVAVWYVLDVDFEPYGKDHATPGGSRDSAKDLAVSVFGVEPPLGEWYEWVGYYKNGRDVGDMGSSDFIGFTPREWLEVAEPEVLRYYYIFHEPHRRLVLGLENVYQYVDQYDRAERLYYGVEKPSPAEEEYIDLIRKSYLYAQLREPPPEPPFQLPYLHAVALVQTLPETDNIDVLLEHAIKRLKMTKILQRDLDEYSLEKLRRRLINARNWVRKYAPETYKIRIVEDVDPGLVKHVSDKVIEKVKMLLDKLQSLEEWNDETIKEAMKSIPKEDKKIEREFFKILYIAFFGKESGPRIAPYFAVLGKEFVINRLRRLIQVWESTRY
ncbi:MAG: lysine--tRNA ligase [Crenarchaeota archaeon]|nr:lysine--tRNA ligase [Thermoproteota archaeon]